MAASPWPIVLSVASVYGDAGAIGLSEFLETGSQGIVA